MEKVTYFFIGGIYVNSNEDFCIDNFQFAADNVQKMIIKGIVENNRKVKVLNAHFNGTYPKHHRKAIFKYSIDNIFDNIECISIAYVNLPLINVVSRFISLIFNLSKLLNKEKDKKVLIVYSLHTPFLLGAFIQMLIHKLEVYVIVPDLPKYMNLSEKKTLIYKFLKKVDDFIQRFIIKKLNGFILFSKNMAFEYNLTNDSYIVVEGMVDISQNELEIDDFNEYMKLKEKYFYTGQKTVLYTGGLNKSYGLSKIIDVFIKLKSTGMQLLICGDGELIEDVISYSEEYSNIKYLGIIKNSISKKIQNEATFLINPRPSNKFEYTKYSFPSKNLEYMTSGRPMIGYKLEGMPIEYYDYIITLENDETNYLIKRFYEISNLDELELLDIGKRARDFVMKNKNVYSQTRKMVIFFESK